MRLETTTVFAPEAHRFHLIYRGRCDTTLSWGIKRSESNFG